MDPTAQPFEIESMQTREPENLFDDDFTPIAEPAPTQALAQETAEAPVFVPASTPVAPASAHTRGRGGNGERGRGRGARGQQRGAGARGGRGAAAAATRHTPVASAPVFVPSSATTTTSSVPAGLAASQHAPASLLESRHAPPAPAPESPAPEPPAAPSQETAEAPSAPTTDAAPVASETPTPPAAAAATPPAATPRTTSVRGDRLATGGLRKPKLTEAELAEKIAGITLKNASLTAAHARAEADAASFAQREVEAASRRKEERRDRVQLMSEREKNRIRKLKAMGGREWDLEKTEDEFAAGGGAGRGGRGYSRGAHGGVAGAREQGNAGEALQEYSDGREYMYREGRGRGGRGGRGRGAGRGDAAGRGSSAGRQQSAPQASEFPDLPAAATKSASQTANGAAPALSFPAKTTKPGPEAQAAQGASSEEQPKAGQASQGPAQEEKASSSWADMVETG